jgi:hypothetical protein
MAILNVQPARITVRADMLQAEVLKVGTPVRVQVGSTGIAESVVIAVSDFISGSNGEMPGYDVTVEIPDGLVSAADMDDPILVGRPAIVTELGEVPTAPAVPLLAIRHHADGTTYIFRAAAAANKPDTQVPVRVIAQAGGYAIIDASAELTPGVEVVLTGERE